MLSQLIYSSYRLLLEICLWISLLGAVASGWMTYDALGAVAGLAAWLVFSSLTFGPVLVLTDIRERVKSIEQSR